MAKTQMQIQEAALKHKAAQHSAKLDAACFGMPGYADGGVVNKRDAQIAAAEAAALGPKAAPPPAAPPPVTLGNGVTAADAEARYNALKAQQAAPAAPPPAPGLLQRAKAVFGFANGGLVPGNGVLQPLEHQSGDDGAVTALRSILGIATPAAPKGLAAHSTWGAAGVAPGSTWGSGDAADKSTWGAANGAILDGPGTGTSDSMTARVSTGEAILPADTVAALGKATVKKIIAATHTPVKARFGMADGGFVDEAIRRAKAARDALLGADGSTVAPPNAPIFGKGTAAAEGLTAAYGPEVLGGNPIGTTQAAQAEARGTSFGVPSTPAKPVAAPPPTPVLSAPAPISALSTQDEVDRRRALIAAPGDTKLHALGDYSAPGTQIFGKASAPGGKINDFIGVGGGKPVPDSGVDFGIKPGEVEAYKAARSAAFEAANAPAPAWQGDPRAFAMREQIAQKSRQLDAATPTQRRWLGEEIAGLNATAAGLERNDPARNAFGLAVRGQDIQRQQNATQMANAQANAIAANDVARQSAKYQYDVAKSAAENAKLEHADAQRQIRLGNVKDELTAYAGGDKQLADIFHTLAATQDYPTGRKLPDGTMETAKLYELDPKAKKAAFGQIRTHGLDYLTSIKAGKVASLSGAGTNEPAGVFGTARHVLSNPGDVIEAYFGSGVNMANGHTAATRLNNADQNAEATAARLKKRFGQP